MEGFEPEILEEKEVGYRCTCSRFKVERALVSLGHDLDELAEQDEPTEVTCQFCDSVYRFSKEDLRNLLKSGRS
jgi:molecular chaperone Hsp33